MQEFVYFMHPTREDMLQSPSPLETELLKKHFQYLKELSEKGIVIVAGPSLRPPYTGIVIFRCANAKEADRLMQSDPVIMGGLFTGRVSEFRCSIRSLSL